jgi:hypothetical protein
MMERHNYDSMNSTKIYENMIEPMIDSRTETIDFIRVVNVLTTHSMTYHLLMIFFVSLSSRFQYWWHGSLTNGTGSHDTCTRACVSMYKFIFILIVVFLSGLDWSRQASSLSGIASRLPDGVKGLFHYQYTWPCSISDSNMGILCIETNCDKRNYYKH